MEELVIKSKKGNPVTTSLLVAEKFSKEHRHVLDAIRNLITSAENSAVLSMFYETTYLNSQNKKQPMFIMNRDGFSLLVMGFNGEKALQFKIEFINAFNRMEKQLGSISVPSRKQLAQWVVELEEQNELAQKEIQSLAPKASYADRVLEHDNQMVDIGQAAKLLKLPFGRNTFFTRLRKDGIFFKSRNEPKQEYIDRGYFDVRKVDIPRENHKDFTVLKVLTTPKGLYWLSKRYGGTYDTKMPSLQLL